MNAMTHIPTELYSFAKPIGAIVLGGVTYVAETITPEIPGVPVWLTSLGFPIAMLGIVIYALVATNKALRDCQQGRLADMETRAKELKDIIEKGHESRVRLIEATNEQTHAITNLVDKMK